MVATEYFTDFVQSLETIISSILIKICIEKVIYMKVRMYYALKNQTLKLQKVGEEETGKCYLPCPYILITK